LPESRSDSKRRPPLHFAGGDLLALDLPELEERLLALGQPAYRARQVFGWLHARGVFRPADMLNLPREVRAALEPMSSPFPLTLEESVQAADGTEKLRFRLGDGGVVESVLIPEDKRLTLCVSTQLGCGMGCTFCRTGRMGLQRNLTPEEILAQVYAVRGAPGRDREVSHLVLMGMGEPLDNLENSLRALRILTHPLGANLSTRKVTVSTVGIPEALERLVREVPVSITLSLNAPDSGIRSELMPINRRYPVEEVLALLRRLPLPPRRRTTMAYVMVKGVNDRPRDARELTRLLHGVRCKINLVPLNPFPGLDLERPEDSRVLEFQALLRARGLSTHVRFSRGTDILAACGQLAAAPSPPVPGG